MCVTESFCRTAESNPLYIICGMVQLLSCVRLFATPWTTARQASLSFTISWSLLKCMSTESVMPSNHLILCRPLLFLPSISPSIRVFSNHQLYFHKKCKKKKKEIRFIIPVLHRQQQKLGGLKNFPDFTVRQRESGSGNRPACSLTVFLPGMETWGRPGPWENLAWLIYHAVFIMLCRTVIQVFIHTFPF